MKTFHFLLWATPILLANSCVDTREQSEFPLHNTSWQVEYLFGDALPAEIGEYIPVLTFSDSTTVSGRGTCNSFHGPFRVEGDQQLDIGPLARTKKYCPQMQIEDQYFFALEATDAFHFNTGKLELLSEEEVVVVFRRSP